MAETKSEHLAFSFYIIITPGPEISEMGTFLLPLNFKFTTMEWKDSLMYFLTATGILNTLFLAVFVFTQKSRNRLSNRLFSAILLMFAIKIGYASLEQQLWSSGFIYFFYTNLAVTAYLCIVPLFIFYIDSISDKDFKPGNKLYLFFLPAMVYAIYLTASGYFSIQAFYLMQVFFISFSLVSGYKLVNLWKQFRKNHLPNRKLMNWLLMIQFGIMVVWATAFGPFVYELTALYSLAVYLLIKTILGDLKTINLGWQSKALISEPKIDLIIRLKAVMETEKIFMDPGLTLPKLAQKLSVSLHSLSREINNYYHQNFTEYINSFRIEEACKMLSSDIYDNLTIEGIAYDCGFNSLSSFNSAFKKQMKLTPSQFRMEKKQSFSISYN
jgi:AraC-like DNA-binding protein